MTRKSTLSAPSTALIGHLKTNGSSTIVQLLARQQFAGVSRTDLLKRLGNLVALGWLDFTWNDDGKKTWFVRASARAIHVSAAAPPAVPSETAPEPTALAVAEPVPPLPVVAPRVTNVMAGLYVPPRSPVLRPGALDFRSCPSVGFRC